MGAYWAHSSRARGKDEGRLVEHFVSYTLFTSTYSVIPWKLQFYLKKKFTLVSAENDPHDGKRKCEALWPIFRIAHQKSRYIYDLYHRRKEISKELYEFCLDQGYADRNLIAKWKKVGVAFIIQNASYIFMLFFFKWQYPCCSLVINSSRRLGLFPSISHNCKKFQLFMKVWSIIYCPCFISPCINFPFSFLGRGGGGYIWIGPRSLHEYMMVARNPVYLDSGCCYFMKNYNKFIGEYRGGDKKPEYMLITHYRHEYALWYLIL